VASCDIDDANKTVTALNTGVAVSLANVARQLQHLVDLEKRLLAKKEANKKSGACKVQ
jgi:hypothetical protein